jgi:hypothetical protein
MLDAGQWLSFELSVPNGLGSAPVSILPLLSEYFRATRKNSKLEQSAYMPDGLVPVSMTPVKDAYCSCSQASRERSRI